MPPPGPLTHRRISVAWGARVGRTRQRTNKHLPGFRVQLRRIQGFGRRAGVGIPHSTLLLRTVRSCGNGNLYYEQKGRHRFRFSLQSQADSAGLVQNSIRRC